MNPALVVKLRPSGPWRSGPDTGARDEVDALYHSDSLYSAVSSAMAALGRLDQWLDATVRSSERPAASFTSCFPFINDIDLIVPPRTNWPPAAVSAKVRWKGARFVPVSEIPRLLRGQPLEEHQWKVDGLSECLIPVNQGGVFRTAVHNAAAVDRLSGSAVPHAVACIEFMRGAGLWTIISFAGEEARDTWSNPIRSAFRWLADSGFGGGRSRGWGRAEEPEFQEGTLPEAVLPENAISPPPSAEGEVAAPAPELAYWLLSLFSPAASDSVDWSRGNYSVLHRGGRIESPILAGGLKKQLPMISEGSVLFAGEPPKGTAPDVAPDGFPHPVFRAGFAVSVPIPWQVSL